MNNLRGARVLSLLLLPFALFAQGTPSYTISSVAGSLAPDSGSGPSVPLYYPTGVGADKNGNVYIVEHAGAVIRMLASDGTLTRFAGNGISGYDAAPSAPATDVSLYQPNSITFGPDGSAYISDAQTVLKVDPTHEMTVLARLNTITQGDCATGSHPLQYAYGIAYGPNGAVYVSSWIQNRVCKLLPDGSLVSVAGTGEAGFAGDGGPAAAAQLNQPQSIGFDGNGNLYIADASNNRIRKVAPDGTISTVAGGGTSFSEGAPALQERLSFPYGVLADSNGELYIANTFGASILKMAQDGTVTTVAGGSSGFAGDGGPANQAGLTRPEQIALAQGNLYIADSGNNRVREVDSSGVISTVAGNGSFAGDGGPADKATLNSPADVAVDTQHNLYIADTENSRIRKVDSAGVITTVAGSDAAGHAGDGGPATSAQLYEPYAVDVDASGDLFIADETNNRVREVDASQTIQTVAGSGSYGYGGDSGPATQALFQGPEGIAVDKRDGSVYVADSSDYRIRHFTVGGQIETVAGTGVYGFSGDGGPGNQAQISFVAKLAVDAQGNVYLADSGNQRIRMIATDGTISTVAGNGLSSYTGDGGLATKASLSYPGGVAVDADGNLYISDTYNNRIRRVSTAGIISTIAGSGDAGFTGDGGPATKASLYHPKGLAVDDQGNVYVADTGIHRIRKLTPGATLGELALVNAASFANGDVTPGMIVSVYGDNLASETAAAPGADLPQSLAGTSVQVTDLKGVARTAGLYFVSSLQINCVIPEGTATGKATVTVLRDGAAVASAEVQVAAVAPALFSANADGMGAPAANVLRFPASGAYAYEPVVMDNGSGKFVAKPIDLGPEGDQVFLVLYGTGIRGFGDLSNISVTVGGQNCPVAGAAAQSQYQGLDQVNVGPLPRSLAGHGSADIVLSVSGHAANTVTVDFQ